MAFSVKSIASTISLFGLFLCANRSFNIEDMRSVITIRWYTVEPQLTATFLADSPYNDSCLTSLIRQLSSVHKVTVVERFNCI